jgi:hypothetical protein
MGNRNSVFVLDGAGFAWGRGTTPYLSVGWGDGDGYGSSAESKCLYGGGFSSGQGRGLGTMRGDSYG